ncbi:uncharacterized protein Dwil_GK12809 [Drosophila willistoni]|uniref:Enhancer of split mbeta protein n=1 Tax=Drosophila willistoni TaxID=7260 RepID=B4NK25_DROWI|nr:enhancer of split mbeta protein [Drosophila willistoni]EDW85067.1 uncharacterized protein Dwil_GK12809 [Drosophila willistoni]
MVLEMEMSKTYQYRKVMKPMLERKRRARINKCLDELKDIMVECLTQEGEHITRLEKADILELTVEHMKKLRAQKQLKLGSVTAAPSGSSSPSSACDSKLSIAESFRAGYVHAANEVSKTLAAVPNVSVDLGTQLMSHLGHRLNYLQVVVPTMPQPPVQDAPVSLVTVVTPPPSECGSLDSSSSVSCSPSPAPSDGPMWRPW